MSKAIQTTIVEQQAATLLKAEQRAALEMLQLGFSDSEIAKTIGVRRETIWRWKHRDPEFQTEFRAMTAIMADAAAERLRGVLDQAVSVVHSSLHSRHADPKLALALLQSMGVLGREQAPVGERNTEEDIELERKLEEVDAKAEEYGGPALSTQTSGSKSRALGNKPVEIGSGSL